MRLIPTGLFSFVICLGIAQVGCQSSDSEVSLQQQLTGNWSGTVYQVYEAKSTASAELDLAQSLTPTSFQVPAGAIQFQIEEKGIKVIPSENNPVSFDLVMFNSKERTLSCMASSGESAADYTILGLTQDSLIMRQYANIMHFDENGNSVNPDTILKEVLIKLKKV